jgi:hypothetical protein
MLHWLTTPTIWKKSSGTSSSGDPSYAADRTIMARWEWKRRFFRDESGNETVSEGTVHVLFSEMVTTGDILVDEFGEEFTVLGVDVVPRANGEKVLRKVYV